MNIEELEAKIKYYAEKYYQGEPIISDEAFDKLVDELKKLKSDSAVLKTGWGFEVQGNKVKHKYTHIGSLDKTKTYSDIPDRFKNKCVFISPKLDGLSAVLYYEKGILKKALTRGNGEFGKDITDKLIKIVGNSIKDTLFTGAVRGELIIRQDNWNKLCQLHEADNMIAPRNYVAGIINRKEIDDEISYISLVVYKVVGQESGYQFMFRSPMLEWLNNNFENAIPIYALSQLTEQCWESQHKSLYDSFLNLGFGLDGLVISSDILQYNSQTRGYIYDEVAFKFQAESTETEVIDIEWTLSRTQRLVPVAIVSPVELSGAVVQRVTCNNAKMVKDLELGEGAIINICRSNEVIPLILDVVESSECCLPKYCPICGSELIWEGVDLKCNNPYCQNITLSDLQQWCEYVGQTDGLQWTLMKQFLDLDNIHSISDIYNNRSYILNKYSDPNISITMQKMRDCYNKMILSNINIKTALTALNIPRLGDKTAELLGRDRYLVEKLLEYSIYKTYDPSLICNLEFVASLKQQLVNCVKTATAESIWSNLSKFVNLRYLYDTDEQNNRITFYADIIDSEIKYIAVTGSLQCMKRKEFEEYISKFRYQLSSNLKKCKYLINNDIASTSTKNKQAKEFNVPIITEQEFLDILNIS